MNKEQNLNKDLSYYLTIFKLEGHETYRVILANTPDGFDVQAKNNKFPKVTEKQVLRIDRLTGMFIQGL